MWKRTDSIRHYLIVNPMQKTVLHHARGPSGDISKHLAMSGDIDLTPRGMTAPVAELLPDLG